MQSFVQTALDSQAAQPHRCVQVHKLEASLRGQKEALEVEVRGTAGQADALREQVGQLRNQASHSLAASEDKLRSMHAQYDDLARCGIHGNRDSPSAWWGVFMECMGRVTVPLRGGEPVWSPWGDMDV